jgi:hypothetical protein
MKQKLSGMRKILSRLQAMQRENALIMTFWISTSPTKGGSFSIDVTLFIDGAPYPFYLYDFYDMEHINQVMEQISDQLKINQNHHQS